MRLAIAVTTCLLLLSAGLVEGHKKESGNPPKKGSGNHSPKGSENPQGTGNDQQQGSQNTQQQGQGNTQQQGQGNTQQQGQGNTQQQGNSPAQDGDQEMEQRELENLIHEVSGRLDEMLGERKGKGTNHPQGQGNTQQQGQGNTQQQRQGNTQQQGQGNTQQQGQGNTQQQGQGNTQQQGQGNTQQQGQGNTQQQGQGNTQQQGQGNTQQQGQGNTQQQGNSPAQDGGQEMEQRELENLIHEVSGRLDEMLGEKKGKGSGLPDGHPIKAGIQKLLKEKAQKMKEHKEKEEVDGSGDVDQAVVKADQVKLLLAEIASLAEKVDVPLDAVKSDFVDSVAHINSSQDLSRFLHYEDEQFQFPIRDFKKMIHTAQRLITRMFAGYERDPECDNFQKATEQMVPKSGDFPKDFHKQFLDKYLMSVSCLSTDNAYFKTDLAMMQELDDDSSKDEILAAITKALVGSIRLTDKMVEQTLALKFIMEKLPEPGVPTDTLVHKRLVDN